MQIWHGAPLADGLRQDIAQRKERLGIHGAGAGEGAEQVGDEA